MVEISEKNFEETITAVLTTGTAPHAGQPRVSEPAGDNGGFMPGGYHQRATGDYDKSLCLIPKDVLDFILITQPKEWEKLRRSTGGDTEAHFLERVRHEVATHGTLHVIRNGIKDLGCTFQLAYFKPASGLNPDIQRLYQGNIFTVIRQVKYSEKNENSLDMVLFLNGLPLFTVELKDPLTGQTVQDAIRQYKQGRDPREPLFAYRRCLAHFAVDPSLVYFTTRLQGATSRFIPFNKGKNLGAGNPDKYLGFSTAYLWEQIWARDSVLNLLQYFVHEIEERNDKGEKTGKRNIIFPRYHQLDAVRRIIKHAREQGVGQTYLVQHSAGSGKSNSIAWLAHQLSVLHDAGDSLLFDSVVVITDRRVLDRQLQETVRQFEQTLGTVETITENSQQLRRALESGKRIIVTTLQKFPFISDSIRDLPGKHYAVIIDEAHSSQSGEDTRHMSAVLSAGSLDEAEQIDSQAEEAEDSQDRILKTMREHHHLPNVSYFAFTATPKPSTLELFGTKGKDGEYLAFSLYPMRQAIEEGFILDVLQSYTTYKTYWSLLKRIKDDPAYDKTKANQLLLKFVDLHDITIQKKVDIIVEHFATQVQHRINGEAKAMVVTRSRLHAVRFKHAIDASLAERGLAIKALVAFSGTVRDGGIDYTEAGMNGIPETQTAETFKQSEYKILIVAEKFQTGFDQPLLHTMYVDKRLKGLHAVQTLSRLNRVYPPHKTETFVLDFVNDAGDIQKAFEPYYERTILSEGTDPNLLYDMQARLNQMYVYEQDEVDGFAKAYFSFKSTQSVVYNILNVPVDRFNQKEKQDKVAFRSLLQDYVRLYAFLSQIVPFEDADLEKLYVFGRYLLRRLVIERDELPVEIQQAIDLEAIQVAPTREGKIILTRGQGEMKPENPLHESKPKEIQMEALSKIIRELNERFGTDFSEDDRLVIARLEEDLIADLALQQVIRVNTPENAMIAFRDVIEKLLHGLVESNFKFYQMVNGNPEFAEQLVRMMFERYRRGFDGAG